MLQKVCLSSFKKEYLQNIPGRARIKVEALRSKSELCMKIAEHFSFVPGIIMVSANPYTAKILIIYDTSKINLMDVDNHITYFFNSKGKTKRINKKVADVNPHQGKVLSLQEFRDSRNVLSKEFRNYNMKAICNTTGLKIDNLWYNLSLKETSTRLETDIAKGLNSVDIEQRLKKYGLNQLNKKNKKSIFSLFLNQFGGFTIKLLLAASGISLLLGQLVDAVTILVIIGIEALLGVWQEYSAEKSLDSLREMSAPSANVIRNGKKMEIMASHIVPGDLICLEAGDIVPVDARLIESNSLEIIEALLTGEAFPVYKKNIEIPKAYVPLGDRTNMVYMGTSVVKGMGKAIAVATGMNSEMGKIVGMLKDVNLEKTPLQQDLYRLSKLISWSCVGICTIVTIGGIMGGHPLVGMFATGVSLAVGAIPEGLSTVLAISLAFGAKRLAKKNAIVKSLPSMETLSCTKVICTDKTGTLTKNEMTVKAIYTMDKLVKVLGEGYNSRGSFLSDGKKLSNLEIEDFKLLLTSSALCNNAQIIPQGNRLFNIKGDPTEAALLIAIEKAGIQLKEFKCYKREYEIPFDPETKKMTAICSDEEGNYFAFTKGAIDIIIGKCTRIMSGNSIEDISEEHVKRLHSANENMADRALRVLALAYKPFPAKPDNNDAPDIEKDMIFLGLVGIMDPPRNEVKAAIRKCTAAGIKVVMITGDHKNTAVAIAKSIGLLSDEGVVLTGRDVESMGEDELSNIIDKVQIFARTCPQQKLKIVKAFKKKGHIVAMTGDGINDAPSLKEAHIGIAMGKTGTEVTKEAASIILTDDNFNTIIKAVEEGRTVNRNIKKFMKYVLSGNFAEVLTIFLASISGLPTPLIPAQILMLNLVTEGIPALALGVDPPEADIMNEPPRNHNKSIFDGKMKNRILTRGIATGLTTLGIFGATLFLTGNLMKARTMGFANLVSCQMLHAFECSSMGIKRNKYLLPSVAISTGIMLASIYIPPLGGIFGMVPLSIIDWAAISFSTIILSRIDDLLKDILYLAKMCNKPSFGV